MRKVNILLNLQSVLNVLVIVFTIALLFTLVLFLFDWKYSLMYGLCAYFSRFAAKGLLIMVMVEIQREITDGVSDVSEDWKKHFIY